MQTLKEIIIVGGGSSIAEGLVLGLKDKLSEKCVIGINYAFRHFDLTALCFSDRDFYRPLHMKTKKEANPDIYEELGKLDLLIIGGRRNADLDKIAHPNTVLISCPKKELGHIPPLSGMFTLSVAEALHPDKIFLLGYDWPTRNPNGCPTGKRYAPKDESLDIHYYKKEIPHAGLGFVGFYENHNPDNYFKFFNSSKSKIYNVSPNSNIQNFEKIDYPKFFKLLSSDTINQKETREAIRLSLK